MTRIAAPLARRIDRLSRRVHRFHRFAHHPLCQAYSGELIPLGRRMRLCRGCSMAAGGLVLGLIAGAFVPPATWRASAALVAASWALLAGSIAARRAGWRPTKIATRFSPALLASTALGHALRAGPVRAALVGAVALAGGWAFAKVYRRRGPDRSPCSACPERLVAVPCSGLLPVVRRERAFRRLSGRWLAGF